MPNLRNLRNLRTEDETNVNYHGIEIPKDRIAEFCRKWMITELSLFGSVLREDFGPDSDVDVLVSLADDAPWSLFEWVDMIDELEALFGCSVDLAVERHVEIIGEAAGKVSKPFQNAHPEIPWRRIIAQSHVLAHEYGEVKHELMWKVVAVHVPRLINALEPLVPSPPPEESI